MPERQDFEAAFIAHVAWIDRFVSILARRHGISPDERSEIQSWVKSKLVEEDYRAFRCFRGESSMTTYLNTVISMLFRDYRAQRWGRWRPSAAALRNGPVAVKLERLVMRDGHSLGEASQILRTSGETDLSDRQLTELMAKLPRRQPMRPVIEGAAALATVSVNEDSMDPALAEEWKRQRDEAWSALAHAVAKLPAEDQVILRMHYWQGSSIADIARALHLDQRPLYRRLKRLHELLQRELEAVGVSRQVLRDLLDESAA